MARMIFSRLESVCKSIHPSLKSQFLRQEKSHMFFSKYLPEVQVRILPPVSNVCHPKLSRSSISFATDSQTLASLSCVGMHSYKEKPTNRTSSKFGQIQCMGTVYPARCKGAVYVYPLSISSRLNSRPFSSFFGGKGSKNGETEVSAGAGAGDVDTGDTNVIESDWIVKMKDVTLDATSYVSQKVRETSDELTPYVQQLLDSHPYLKNVIIPVSSTMTATIFAWVVMPKILRRFHKYAMRGPAALFPGTFLGEEVPYEKSFWGALEDPVRYLLTFVAFTQIAIMIAPKALASQYIADAWKGAVILSFIWFLHRWKTNVISRALAVKNLQLVDREKLLALDKLSSLGLFVIGLMALAEACGVAVQSILTVGGIGGVATAFAARDILGNVLSGLSMQFSKPFSLGDTIKAGNVEGQVVEMGLTTTSLLNAEKFPVIVPNSLFSSQVIVNKSRAEWRAMVTKIPLQSDELEKIPQISNDIKNMLKSHPKVFLGKEAPYCFLSRVEGSFAELSLGCNLKFMSKDELYSTQEDILLQSVLIIKQHGAKLGSTMHDLASQ